MYSPDEVPFIPQMTAKAWDWIDQCLGSLSRCVLTRTQHTQCVRTHTHTHTLWGLKAHQQQFQTIVYWQASLQCKLQLTCMCCPWTPCYVKLRSMQCPRYVKLRPIGMHHPCNINLKFINMHHPCNINLQLISMHHPCTINLQLISMHHPCTTNLQLISMHHPCNINLQLISMHHPCTINLQLISMHHPCTINQQLISMHHPCTINLQLISMHHPCTKKPAAYQHAPSLQHESATYMPVLSLLQKLAAGLWEICGRLIYVLVRRFTNKTYFPIGSISYQAYSSYPSSLGNGALHF